MRVGLFGTTLEDALQNFLERYPENVPGKQIRPGAEDSPPFVLLRREAPIVCWSLDQPLVDQFSALTLVECELLANPESRREVIGQNIEYAANAVQPWEGGQLRIQLIQYNHELSRLQRPNHREQAWSHPNRYTVFQGDEFLG
jgi:hypothetical protein